MKFLFSFASLLVLLVFPASSQTASSGVTGKKYANSDLGFSITFPETWLVAGDDFEDHMREQGYDIGLKAPAAIDRTSQLQVNKALERVKILVTAYRTLPGSSDNAILRVSTEDLSFAPAVKDAVDYFDLMRSQFALMRLPADFKYSETQAEQLGAMQFAFLDTSSNAGKKRMYATVRNGVAIMFTLSYTKPEDLKTLRDILTKGDFRYKN